jgi:3-hydroxybutyryl-CoA dehydrogenase
LPEVGSIKTVTIVGAGPLGRRLAFLSAQAGFRTILEDVLPSALRNAAAEVQNFAVAASLEQANPIEYASNLETAVREADLIIDCVPDELESKLEIFSLLDRMAPPRSILATPTTTQSIADLAACTYRPERCVALQLKPIFLGQVSLPEIIPIFHTPRTEGHVLEAIAIFWNALGHTVHFQLDSGESYTPAVVQTSLT